MGRRSLSITTNLRRPGSSCQPKRPTTFLARDDTRSTLADTECDVRHQYGRPDAAGGLARRRAARARADIPARPACGALVGSRALSRLGSRAEAARLDPRASRGRGAGTRVVHAGDGNARAARPSGDPARLDRKSTRLNSSHGYISYAV